MSLFFQWDTSEKKASNSTRKSWKKQQQQKKQQEQQQTNKKQNKKEQLKKLKSQLELIDYSLTNYIKTIDVFKYTRPIK